MPGGGCRGGIPGLGPCKTWPGRAITGAVGEPSCLSLPASESASLLESLMSSGGLTPAVTRGKDSFHMIKTKITFNKHMGRKIQYLFIFLTLR